MNESNMSDNRSNRHPFYHMSGGFMHILCKKTVLVVSFLLISSCIHSAGAETEYYITKTSSESGTVSSVEKVNEFPSDFMNNEYWLLYDEKNNPITPTKALDIGPVGTEPRTLATFSAYGIDYTLIVPRIPEKLRNYLDAEGYSVIKLLANDHDVYPYLYNLDCNQNVILYFDRMQLWFEKYDRYYIIMLAGASANTLSYPMSPEKIDKKIHANIWQISVKYATYQYNVQTGLMSVINPYLNVDFDHTSRDIVAKSETIYPDGLIRHDGNTLDLDPSVINDIINTLSVQNSHFGKSYESLIRDKQILLYIK